MGLVPSFCQIFPETKWPEDLKWSWFLYMGRDKRGRQNCWDIVTKHYQLQSLLRDVNITSLPHKCCYSFPSNIWFPHPTPVCSFLHFWLFIFHLLVHANQSRKKKTAFELLVIATNVVASNSQDVFFSSFFFSLF